MNRKVVARRKKTPARWSHEDSMELRRLYGSETNENLARRFGRSVGDIEHRATELALRKNKAAFKGTTRMPRWTSEQVSHLRDHYADTPNLTLALELGRSVKSVVSKAHHLGLHKSEARLASMGRENVAFRHNGSG
jgi:hypothetical protein